MTRKDYTEIVLVVDRSGSMNQIKEDAQGGINTFIDEQKKQPGEAKLTLVHFDDKYEFVHRGVPIKDVGQFELKPRNLTALLDALGRSIVETGERLAAMPEHERPGLVIVVVVTDGLENASKEFDAQTVKSMTVEQSEKYDWQFIYLGANQDAFKVGGSMGVDVAANYGIKKSREAYAATCANVSRMRGASMDSMEIVNEYTPDELAAMQGDDTD